MNFGEVLEELKHGKSASRSGWNGKGMLIYLKEGSFDRDGNVPSHIDGIHSGLFNTGDIGTSTRLPTICMKTASGTTLEGWLASQTDMLAEDWAVNN